MTDNRSMGSGTQPAEGRDDLAVPGADREAIPLGPPSERPDAPVPGIANQLRDIGDQPDAPEAARRDDDADRVPVGMPAPARDDDLRPDVEVPDDERRRTEIGGRS